MGCTIHLEDLRRYFPAKCTVAQLKRATPIGLGMLSQFGLMPLIAFLLGHVFNLTPAEHISAIIIGCTPGGTTSNLFAYWCNGDTGLSIAMTVCSTFIALFAQTGLIKLYADTGENSLIQQASDSGSEIIIPYSSLIAVIIAILVPVGLGIWTRKKSYFWSMWGSTIGNTAGSIVVVALIVYGSITMPYLWTDSGPHIWGVSILMGLCGFTFGMGAAMAAGMSRKQARTIALETGIQNGPLAITLIQLSFADNKW